MNLIQKIAKRFSEADKKKIKRFPKARERLISWMIKSGIIDNKEVQKHNTKRPTIIPIFFILFLLSRLSRKQEQQHSSPLIEADLTFPPPYPAAGAKKPR